MVDDPGPEVESDMRRRAAWLLGMLALVAVLFVVVMTSLIGTDSGSNGNANGGPGPLDGSIATSQARSSSTPHGSSSSRTATHAKPTHAKPAASTSSATKRVASCPTSQPCALDQDIGNAIDAINAYRVQHGQPSVPGTVSAKAKACALANGSGCSGGWAESQVPGPSGSAAVKKIIQFGKLLDPQLKSFGVGWAYDPGSKQYFFAIVRND